MFTSDLLIQRGFARTSTCGSIGARAFSCESFFAPDAVDLGEHVRHEGLQPGVGEVEHLHLAVAEGALHRRKCRGRRAHRVQHVVFQHSVAVCAGDGHSVGRQPQQHPPAAERSVRVE
eukprot:688387-Prorocentrum_minimum.AAC.5